MLSGILIVVIIAALSFAFINGFHDTANAIATSVYTKALSPKDAIMLAAVMNFVGTLVSEKVAMTISKGIVNIQLEQHVILAALVSAILWSLFTWWKGIPSSSSHALIGGLIGATIVYSMSLDTIIWSGVLNKVIIPLFMSPVLGFLIGFSAMHLLFKLFVNWSQGKVNGVFLKMQVISSAFIAFSHGNNDSQKTMGIITLALISGGMLDASHGVPMWVKIACAITMAVGTSVGGWKIMKTVGSGVTKLEPSSGFASQMSSALCIELMTFLGAPVSTTQIITTSIMGAGTAKRVSSVKWGNAGNIIKAWFITLPITIAIGGVCVYVFELFM